LKVAALYDVHGMPHALEAVLAEVEREPFDAVVFGGDLFLGPLPRETLELVRSVDAQFVRGNCERIPDEWLRAKLGEEATTWSSGWPTTHELDGVLYCHATPESDEPILTDASPEERFAEALAGVDARLVVAGHTHMQFRRGRFVNAGSVGMPYEGEVAAFWATVADGVEFRRTPFDVDRAVAEIRASDWPGAEEFVAENLLSAPSREEATAHFESVA
jgi:diadenosine tetraphosphatase ApaH/serine/threonine PP2A family protein phosphatase